MSGFQTDQTSAFQKTLQRWDYKMEKKQTDLIKILQHFKATM